MTNSQNFPTIRELITDIQSRKAWSSEPPVYDPVDCSTCHDARFLRYEVPLGHPNFGKSYECPSCSPPLTPRGLPEDLRDKTFQDFDQGLNPAMAQAFVTVLEVARGNRWSALLDGQPGLGKSHLAAAALNERWGYFWTWGALQRHLRKLMFSRDGPELTEEDAIRGWAEGQFLLVIDDIGAEMPSDPTWSNGILYAILDSRYRLRLPTILTTNNSAVLEDRVVDRYRSGLVVCRGRSQRPARA